jgi:hypothetical protein
MELAAPEAAAHFVTDGVCSIVATIALTDQVLSYAKRDHSSDSCSDRYGMPELLEFFRISNRVDDVATIKQRFNAAIGAAFETAESDWMSTLRNR